MISNIDTLIISFDFDRYGLLIKDYIDYFDLSKNASAENDAKILSQNEHVTFMGMDFEILGNGTKGYSYLLHSDQLEIKIAKFRSGNKNTYPIIVRFKAELLWAKGLNSYHWLMDKIHRYLGEPFDERISRVDFACHIDGLGFTTADIDRFVGRHRKDSLHRKDRKVQTIYIGSRSTQKIMMRIYNKSQMVLEEKTKEWFFNVWNNHNMMLNNVWNIEFELHRAFLRELKLADGTHGIRTFIDLTDNLRQIWQYLTQSWVRHVNLESSKRRERCKASEFWKQVQNGFIEYDMNGYIEREVIILANQNSLMPGLVGYVTSYCAKSNIHDIDSAMYHIGMQIPLYLKKSKGIGFEDAVYNKWLYNQQFIELLAEEAIKSKEPSNN